MGQDLLGRLYRGRTDESRVDGTGGRLLMVDSGEEGVTWRYAVCQLCLGLEGLQLTSLAKPGPTLVICRQQGSLHRKINPPSHNSR